MMAKSGKAHRGAGARPLSLRRRRSWEGGGRKAFRRDGETIKPGESEGKEMHSVSEARQDPSGWSRVKKGERAKGSEWEEPA